MPTHVILRKLFTSEIIGEVFVSIATVEGRCPKNYPVTTSREGILDIEMTTTDEEFQFPEKEMLTHANYFKVERVMSTDLAPLLVLGACIHSSR